jgi:uncharacterized protein (TIGR02145 family)
MKNTKKTWFYPFIIMGMLLMLTSSCKKDKEEDPSSITVTDFDGNVYHSVTIGTQVWLVENLKVTHYRNGDAIPNVTGNTQWEASTTGAYCNYDNSVVNGTTYGRLYNWYAVNDSRKICPTGWHVPSDVEWTVLTTYLGGAFDAGAKLKEKGTTHWKLPNAGATNASGFTALPAGHRIFAGGFEYLLWGCGFWGTNLVGNDATVMYLDYNTTDFYHALEGRNYGRSVRCIQD